MLVNCNSCEKKFNVPDEAITATGRLLQCGSCGYKWTQYPSNQTSTIKEKSKKEIPSTKIPKIKETKQIRKISTSRKKEKRKISLYSEEYLKKKHGLIIDNKINSRNLKTNKIYSKSNFFKYLINTSILAVALFGVLNLTKETIIVNYSHIMVQMMSFL